MINSDTKGFAISNPYKAAEHQGAPWLLVISVRRGVKTRQVAILGTFDVVPYVQDSTRRGEASRGRQKFHLQIKLLLVNIRFFCVAGGPGPALVRGAGSAFPFRIRAGPCSFEFLRVPSSSFEFLRVPNPDHLPSERACSRREATCKKDRKRKVREFFSGGLAPWWWGERDP